MTIETTALLDQRPPDRDEAADPHFRDAVLRGLAHSPKSLPCKYFYDARGSHLFERICELDEYYPTRTETAILRSGMADIVARLPARAVLVEFGSGASVKVRMLLDQMREPVAYVPVDISEEHLLAAAQSLSRDYPDVQVFPVAADFTHPFRWPVDLPEGPRVGFFPGSTIGNFSPHEAEGILYEYARRLGPVSWLLIGVDLRKREETLLAAYNDAAGVTAEFNLNLLTRINRELGGTFDLDRFEHQAIWNHEAGRIEMHLVSRASQTVRVDGQVVAFRAGETIHTENSYKFTVDGFHTIAAGAGYRPLAVWTDPDKLFSVHLLATFPG